MAREIGAAVRKHREDAGLTLRAFEERIGHANAKISMWENGHRLIPMDALEQILDALDVAADERDRLLGLRREAEGPGRIVAGPATIGAQLAELIQQEQAATRIVEVAPLLIPGLLQTSAYARAILTRHADVEARVTLRMGRSDVLTRRAAPAQFHALIDTEVLVRHVAPPKVMADQMRHLLQMAELPNVTVQLVSSTHIGYTPMLDGPFIVLEFPTATPVVHLEHHSASGTLWEEVDVRRFQSAAAEIAEVAMTPDRTSEVIEELIQGMEKS